jgi:hypothetical protein
MLKTKCWFQITFFSNSKREPITYDQNGSGVREPYHVIKVVVECSGSRVQW